MGKPQPGTRPVLALLANRDTITYNSILVSVLNNLSLHCSFAEKPGWNSARRVYCIPYQPEERKIRSCPPTKGDGYGGNHVGSSALAHGEGLEG